MLLWLCMDYTWWSCYCFLQGSEYVCIKEQELSEEIFDHNEPNLICNCCTILQLKLAIFSSCQGDFFQFLKYLFAFQKIPFCSFTKIGVRSFLTCMHISLTVEESCQVYVVQLFFLKVMEIFVFRFKKIFDELKKEFLLKTLGHLTNYFSTL